MPGASHISNLPSFQTSRGYGLIDSSDMAKFYNLLMGNKVNITAGAGGGLANAILLMTGVNEVNVVGTAADSLMLPAAISGSSVWVVNNGALSTTIYNTQTNSANNNVADVAVPHGSVTPGAPTAGIALASGHATLFVVSSLGRWKQVADFA